MRPLHPSISYNHSNMATHTKQKATRVLVLREHDRPTGSCTLTYISTYLRLLPAVVIQKDVTHLKVKLTSRLTEKEAMR